MGKKLWITTYKTIRNIKVKKKNRSVIRKRGGGERDGIKRDLELAFLIILMPEHASVLLIEVKAAADFCNCISTAWRIIIILQLNIPFLTIAPVLPSLVCLPEQRRSCKVIFSSVQNQGIFLWFTHHRPGRQGLKSFENWIVRYFFPLISILQYSILFLTPFNGISFQIHFSLCVTCH